MPVIVVGHLSVVNEPLARCGERSLFRLHHAFVCFERFLEPLDFGFSFQSLLDEATDRFGAAGKIVLVPAPIIDLGQPVLTDAHLEVFRFLHLLNMRSAI